VLPAVVLRGVDPAHICPIIDPTLRDFRPSGDEQRDVEELTRLIMRSMEDIIRSHPDQWFIFRRMWASGSSRTQATGQLAEGV
jgi:lauroyl/myristoyl acyltransferase